MTSFVRVFVVVMFAVAAVAGQVTTTKDDITAEKYYEAEKKAAELLEKVNYRSVWTRERIGNRISPEKLEEKKLIEIILPDKKRTLIERFSEVPFRLELIELGKERYSRTNNELWRNSGLGNGSGGGLGSGVGVSDVQNQFRYLPQVLIDGKKAEFYENIHIRTANKFLSRTEFVTTRRIRTTRSWYSEGRLLKKIEETAIEGQEELLREVTIYEYNPKDLKIEAPVIK